MEELLQPASEVVEFMFFYYLFIHCCCFHWMNSLKNSSITLDVPLAQEMLSC